MRIKVKIRGDNNVGLTLLCKKVKESTMVLS